MFHPLPPIAERKPRLLATELLQAEQTLKAQKELEQPDQSVIESAQETIERLSSRKVPHKEALRLSKLDFSTLSNDDLKAELSSIMTIARLAAESSAGADDIDYWDRWQFNKICTPDMVLRLCELASTQNSWVEPTPSENVQS